jgi:hypothetical protein
MSICATEPASSDVLIQRDAAGRCTIGSQTGVPQIDCADFEQALYRAGGIAARAGSDLWYVSAGGSPRRLTDVFPIRRLWNEYVEMPTLRLTQPQIRRLMDVDEDICDAVIAVLVEVGLLQRSDDGTYARATVRHALIPALRMKRPARHAR